MTIEEIKVGEKFILTSAVLMSVRETGSPVNIFVKISDGNEAIDLFDGVICTFAAYNTVVIPINM